MIYARGHKVDVCHMDEYGIYNLINVEKKALQAHINHGDSIPGDLVPGSGNRFSFDDDCTLIPGCPCVADLPSDWTPAEAISNISFETCADGLDVIRTSATVFDADNITLSFGKIEQCDGPTLFSCAAGGNTQDISEAQYMACTSFLGAQ